MQASVEAICNTSINALCDSLGIETNYYCNYSLVYDALLAVGLLSIEALNGRFSKFTKVFSYTFLFILQLLMLCFHN